MSRNFTFLFITTVDCQLFTGEQLAIDWYAFTVRNLRLIYDRRATNDCRSRYILRIISNRYTVSGIEWPYLCRIVVHSLTAGVQASLADRCHATVAMATVPSVSCAIGYSIGRRIAACARRDWLHGWGSRRHAGSNNTCRCSEVWPLPSWDAAATSYSGRPPISTDKTKLEYAIVKKDQLTARP